MATEALEGIVCDTHIDLYPPGTAVLYGHFRQEEEEMMRREELERNQREIGTAIWAVQDEYGRAEGSPQDLNGLLSQMATDVPAGLSGYEGSIWDINATQVRQEASAYTFTDGTTVRIIEPVAPLVSGGGCKFDSTVEAKPEFPAYGGVLEGVTAGLAVLENNLAAVQCNVPFMPAAEPIYPARPSLSEIYPSAKPALPDDGFGLAAWTARNSEADALLASIKDRMENGWRSTLLDTSLQAAKRASEEGIFEKSQYAKTCGDWGFGTVENVHIDKGKKERIKIYTDVVSNVIGVGYETFDDDHTQKKWTALDAIWATKG